MNASVGLLFKTIGDFNMFTSEKTQEMLQGNRVYWFDNLRTFMIFLVVVLHAGLVYESSGISAFFWIVDDPSINTVSGILNIIIDIIAMPTIFFISGYFTPISLKNKDEWTFLKSKFKRLIFPWMIAVLTLIPLYKVIFLFSRNIPQDSWTTYFHWTNGIWDQNWLWFLPVLFMFDVIYLFMTKIKINISRITFKHAVWTFMLIAFLYSFCMDIFGRQGWTKTLLMDFQNEKILIYFMVFLLGALSYRLNIFESNKKNYKFYVLINIVAWIPITMYMFMVIYSLIKPGSFLLSGVLDTLLLQLSYTLSLLCLLYLMITTFRYYVNGQGAFRKEMNKNSYSVYIIHVAVMGGIALILLHTSIPSFYKHLILIVSTFVVSNLLITLYRYIVKTMYAYLNVKKVAVRTATTAMIVGALVTIAGCGNRVETEKVSGQGEASTATQTSTQMGLHQAALQGDIDVVRYHIEAGSDINTIDPEGGASPLIIAATFGQVDVARSLIEAGAEINLRNNDGSTALITATFLCHTEIVELLLGHGADKNVRNNAGSTALDSVAGPFHEVEGIYHYYRAALGPLGLELDFEHVKTTRPQIAAMLR